MRYFRNSLSNNSLKADTCMTAISTKCAVNQSSVGMAVIYVSVFRLLLAPRTREQGKVTGVGVHTVGKLEEIVDTLITTNNFLLC